MTNLPPLLVDRFLARSATQALDLATGEMVIVRRHAWRQRSEEARWAEHCAHFLHLSHHAICALIDYGPCGGAQSFEAWRSDGVWAGEASRARDCIGLAGRYLQSCGLTPAAADGEVHSADGAPVLLPGTLTAESLEGLDDKGSGEDADSEHCGVCIETPACAVSISEALADARPQRPRVFSVWADEARDVGLAYRHVARAARLCGFLPVALSALSEARGYLVGRSTCLLSPQSAAESWRAWLTVSLESGRAVVLVCADADPPGSVVRLPSPQVPFAELMRSLRPRACADAALPAVRRAAQQARGSLSRFSAALLPVAAAASVLPWQARLPGRLQPGANLAARAGEPPGAYGTLASHPLSASAPAARGPRAAGDLILFRSRMRQAVQEIDRGRHAAGQRALRRAVGALSRRHDHAHVVVGGLDLARLHLRRGQLKEAKAALADASEAASGAERHDLLAHVAVLSGVVALNELRLDEAEALLRTARTVAEGLSEPEIVHASARALARCLFWRGRYDEAFQVLSGLSDSHDDPRGAIRLALAQASVAIGTGDLASAVSSADRACILAAASAPDLAASAATALAFCHLTVGDARALGDDVRRAVAAARRTHRPLCALRARLIWAEAERRAGRSRPARVLADRIGRVRGLPALLRAQAALLGDLLRDDDERAVLARHTRVTGLEALSLFVPAGTNPAMPARHVVGLLECCQAAEGEQALLRAVCERLRPMLDAAATAFVVRTPSGLALAAGSGGRVGFDMVERVEALAAAILPHAGTQAIEGGVPVRYGGRAIGVLVARWPLGTQPLGRECGALMLTAATAAAPALAAHIVGQHRVHLGPRDTGLLGISAAIETVRQAVARAALAPFPVLIQGESGCGKELVARAIHRQSTRRDRPLCTVNCAALPDDLVESELFGHARGAFTGALNERIGVFEAAHQGTLFLDEIGELSLRAQAKVLRTVQDGEVRRVGENVSRRVDARLVAATNRDLREEAAAGRFRGDLLYRLDVIRIFIPPLRERRDDVPVLADALWRDASERVGSRATLAAATLAQLARYDWPGNVRELQNVMAALAVQAPRCGVVGPASLPSPLQAIASPSGARLDQARRAFEAEFVRAALARAGGQRTRAAEELGVTRQGLTKIIARYGLAGGDRVTSDGPIAGHVD